MTYSKYILLLFVILSAGIVTAQDPFTVLTQKVESSTSETLEEDVEKIYQKEIKKKKFPERTLKVWKLFIYDSTGVSGKADTLAFDLSAKPVKAKYAQEAIVYKRLGNIEADSNHFEAAITLYHKGMEISRSFGDKRSIAAFKRMIGTSYLKLEQNSTAEKHLRESYGIYKSIGDSLGMANATISLGNALKDQGNLDAAEKYYTISLDLARKLNNKRLIAGNYNNLGNVERRRNNHRKALDYFFQALEMNKASDNKLWQSFNYHNIANAYSDLKDYPKAIEYFKISNAIKVELGDSLSLITGYQGLSEAYAKTGDYKNAYDNLLKHVRLKDTLGLVEQAKLLKELETKYESEKQAIEIDRLKTAEKLKDEVNKGLELESRKNRNLAVLAIVAGLLLLGGVAILLRSNKVKRKHNELLNVKNNEIESSNLKLKFALEELSDKNKEIIDSINYATYIQRATLPNISQHTSDGLQFELFFAPKDIVSGDFYFSFQLYNQSIFGVADCTGHGVPGAMMSLVGMNSLEKVVREEKHQHTSQMVESLNGHVLESLYRGNEEINDGMDISFCCLDQENNMLHFTGANHTAYVIRNNANVDELVFSDIVVSRGRTDAFSLIGLNGTRRPIGRTHSDEAFVEVSFKLCKGDRIVLFSDGYADQIGGDHAKKLKKGALLEFILRSAELKVADQAEFMKQQFEKWKGHHEQVDDVCMLFVEVKK